MDILLAIIPLIIGGLLNFILKPKAKIVYNLAIGYIFLELFLSISTWVYYFAGIKNELIIQILSELLEWGKSLGYLILGYLIINILLALRSKDITADNHLLKKITRSTLWGVSILTGNLFIIATVGKTENLAEMTSFFTLSGYAIWFLYFIMTVETLGGIGVLLHFKLRTGPVATAGLLLIMLGAVYTHLHNKDPFSDSYAAVRELITLLVMLIIYYFEQQVNARQVISSSLI